jgi:hypothetical protein
MRPHSSARPAQSPPQERETRPCRSCRATGWILADAEYDFESGELVEESVPCFTCRGERVVFVYPERRA